MTRGRARGRRAPAPNRPLIIRVLDVRFYLNWQWPAIEMQYNRLIDRGKLPMNERFGQHMQMIADMDFMVIMVRRLLRTAEQAMQIPSDSHKQLKTALRIFHSRWKNLTDIRNALEHPDSAQMMYPSVAVSENEFIFMWPGGNVDLAKIYDHARTIKDAILAVIVPLEQKWNAMPDEP